LKIISWFLFFVPSQRVSHRTTESCHTIRHNTTQCMLPANQPISQSTGVSNSSFEEHNTLNCNIVMWKRFASSHRDVVHPKIPANCCTNHPSSSINVRANKDYHPSRSESVCKQKIDRECGKLLTDHDFHPERTSLMCCRKSRNAQHRRLLCDEHKDRNYFIGG